MSEKKTTLLSLRNQNWRTVKSETGKVNDLLTNILTNDITVLNDFIYAGIKFVCENIGVPLKITDRKSKPGWGGPKLESQIKKRLWQQSIILKQNIKKFSDETKKAGQRELQKRLRRPTKNNRERRKTEKMPRQDQTIQTKQNVPKQRKKNSINYQGVNGWSHTNNRMRDRQEDFGAKYGNGKIITKKPDG